MDSQDFEGTLVLERIAAIDKVEEFFDAVDSDDFKLAATLMRQAGLDERTVSIVLAKMAEADGEH